jgi:hypothetical protein
MALDQTWPPTLPDNFLQEGYQEGAVNNLIKTDMISGPSKRRPRSSVVYQPVTGGMNLTTQQKDIMLDFYQNTISYGALPFTMPVYGGGTVDVFLDAYTTVPLSGDIWRMTMNLLRLI